MRLLPALGLTLNLAPADAARAKTAQATPVMEPGMEPVMELVSFRLVAGTSDAAFLAAAKTTALPLQGQPGFRGRHLTRAEDGTWTDHVLWSSLPQAMAGAEQMTAEPAFQPFMALIDGATVAMRHEPVLWQMD
jgi:hypothetical protein